MIFGIKNRQLSTTKLHRRRGQLATTIKMAAAKTKTTAKKPQHFWLIVFAKRNYFDAKIVRINQ
jgi:hypothetical protein